MHIYVNHKSGKRYNSAPACSYCRKPGHNKNDCPHALEDWENGWKDLKVPITTTNTNCSWYKQPRYWGEWYKKCKELVELQRYRETYPKLRTKRRLKDVHCGFCGEKGHTRRNCLPKQQFIEGAYAANTKWRQLAYNYLVNEMGISVGSVVKVINQSGYYGDATYTDGIGTVVSINWDELTLGASEPMYHGWGNGDYRSRLEIKVLVNGEVQVLSQAKRGYGDGVDRTGHIGKKIADHRIFANDSICETYRSPIFNGVVSRAKHEWSYPTTEFAHATNPAFDFIARKKSHEKLEENRIVHTIDSILDWA